MILRRSKLQSWSAAQMFEFRHAKKYMNGLHIAELLQKANSRDFLVSNGYFDSSLVNEYFDGSLDLIYTYSNVRTLKVRASVEMISQP